MAIVNSYVKLPEGKSKILNKAHSWNSRTPQKQGRLWCGPGGGRTALGIPETAAGADRPVHGPPWSTGTPPGYLGISWMGPGMMIRMTIRIMIYHDSYINCYYYVYSDEDDADRDHEFECGLLLALLLWFLCLVVYHCFILIVMGYGCYSRTPHKDRKALQIVISGKPLFYLCASCCIQEQYVCCPHCIPIVIQSHFIPTNIAIISYYIRIM